MITIRLMKSLLVTILLTFAFLARIDASTQSQDSGTNLGPPPSPTAPIWAKLVLAGNTVTCYYATSVNPPTTWTQLGTPQTIAFINSPILVGMYICSHNASSITTGTIDNFSISPTPAYRLADADIGSPAYMGSANLINGVWNLSGCGLDIWQGTDQFNFQPWLVWGDCTVTCRITSVAKGDQWEKIGIMIRDGYNSGSDYAMFCASGGAGVDFQWRPKFNDNPDVTQLVAPPAPGVVSSVGVGYSPTGPTAYVVRP
jgi:hypothetical protein